MVSGNYGYYNPYQYGTYPNYGTTLASQNYIGTAPLTVGTAPVYTGSAQMNAVYDETLYNHPPKKKPTADGKDDGRIGFWGATKNFVKGVGKFFTGMFTDENGKFSLGKTLKTAAVIVGVGALCVLTAGTAVPAILAAGGILAGGIGMAKAGINIASAKTDAEAEAAWQSLGSNTTGTALAVMGAKSIAKGAGVDTSGVRGAGRAVKHVFTESGSAIKNSASGVYNAAKSGYGIGGKFDAVKSNVSKQLGDFTTTVKGNYNKAVYGTKTKIDDDAAALEKKSNDLQSKIDKTKNSVKNSALERQKATIDAKKAALDEIKGKNSWDDVNSVIENNKSQITTKKTELASATDKADKARIQTEIDALTTKVKTQEGVLSRRTGEAQHIRRQIEAKEAQRAKLDATKDATKITELEAEINALKAKQEFTIPNKNDLGAMTADDLNNIKTTNGADSKTYQDASRKFDIQNGNGYTHVPKEVIRTAYKDPASRWLTVGIAGKQFGTTPEMRFYSMLTPEEKLAYQALSVEEKAALVEQYKTVA